jgi:hypothetical protein
MSDAIAGSDNAGISVAIADWPSIATVAGVVK